MRTTPLLYIIIAVLFAVVIFQRCNAPKCESVTTTDTVRVIDTAYVYERDTVHLKAPALVDSVPGKVPDFMVASTDCNTLKIQHEVMNRNYFAHNIFRDTFSRDSSYLILTDTVTQNRIVGRKASFQLHKATIRDVSTITNTVTIDNTKQATRQVYLGGGISGNKTNLINRFELGLLYKDRKDRMFGVKTDMDMTGQVSYGVKSYWKIKLK